MITLTDGSEKVRLEDFGFQALTTHSNSSSGNFDRKLQYIPERFAPWDFGVQQKGKTMNINCKSFCSSESELEKNINKFNSFVLDNDKNPKTLKMYYDYEPDKFYYVQLDAPFDPDRSTILKGLSIQFFAGDSSKYASSNQYDTDKKIIYGEVETGDYYPNTKNFKWTYKKHYSGIYNYSSFTTNIKIIIVGTVKGGSVKHLKTGKKLTFPDITDGRIVLNSEDKTVEKNYVDVLEGSNYNFFDLSTGDNGFEFMGESASAVVTFEWVHRF